MSRPFGLALDGNKLFVCDIGVKMYDISDPGKFELKNTISVDAFDVIAHEGILMIIGRDGLYQYDYTTDNLTLLSHIPTL